MSSDVAASIRAHLLREAKERGEEFELFLVRYAVERFLYRLGESALRDRCVLKGAALLTLWMDDPYRASRDIDLLVAGPSDDAAVKAIVTTVIGTPCPEDGLRFDVDGLKISPIREGNQHPGQRAVMCAFLGKARIRVQIDFGFGDAVRPAPEESIYPTLLETLPAPSIRTYPQVVSIAEKFEAMLTIGRRNSRMKDFHDVWALSGAFPFEGAALAGAIAASLARRATPWTPEAPDVLTSAFYRNQALQARWAAYLRASGLRELPPERFEEVGERLRQFLLPARDAIVAGMQFEGRWSPGGPWH